MCVCVCVCVCVIRGGAARRGEAWRGHSKTRKITPKVARIGAIFHDFMSGGGRQMRKSRYLGGAERRGAEGSGAEAVA